jgi:hypothetical protein
MKEIIYISTRNTLIGKGNFSKPELFSAKLESSSAEEIYQMATNGDASFFDEDGETIELNEAIPLLKMLMSINDSGVEAVNQFLLLHNESDANNLAPIQKLFETNASYGLIAQKNDLDNLDVTSGLMGKASHVGYLFGDNFEETIPSIIISHIVAIQKKQKPIVIKPPSLNIYTSISPAFVTEAINNLASKYQGNEFVSKRIQMFKSKTDDILKHFFRMKQVNIEDLEYLEVIL